ncbi:MAG: MerR family transcriptional regulator [Erysipelotrichaceae bacterium]|nr:MerR family transcriptional regulator [Erysipelotrichaceae bacterium]
MLIHEIAKECGITKKAVQYYVDEGLLFPTILENGYKDFCNEDRKALKKIVLYRKLGLSVQEIKVLQKDPTKLDHMIHQRVLDIEYQRVKLQLLNRIQMGDVIEDLEQEIYSINPNSMIIQRLLELFPSYYGRFLSFHFSRFLTHEIETTEQMKAFQDIIEFLDDLPDIDLPEDLQQYLHEYSLEDQDMIQDILQNQEDALKDIEAFMLNNSQIIEDYYRIKQTEEYMNTPAYRLMVYMKSICTNSGYYDIFIPAMRKLSPTYNAYYNQLMEANKKFIEIYPEYSNIDS